MPTGLTRRPITIGSFASAISAVWPSTTGEELSRRVIEPQNFCSDTVNYIVQPKTLKLYAVLALLNSSLWEWRFRLTSTNNHVNAYEIEGMPLPHISFTTPPDKRTALVAEAKQLYERGR